MISEKNMRTTNRINVLEGDIFGCGVGNDDGLSNGLEVIDILNSFLPEWCVSGMII
jgi:hypothetical protein